VRRARERARRLLLTVALIALGAVASLVVYIWMAELAGPEAAGTTVGLGLAVSSAGVTVGPLAFGQVVQAVGGFRGPWLALAACMALAVGGLYLGRYRRRPA
jgi:predicted MFS family arabinose efflux permease